MKSILQNNKNLIFTILAIGVGFFVGGYIGKDSEQKKVVLTKDVEQLFKPTWDRQDSLFKLGYQSINDSLNKIVFRFEKAEEILFNFNTEKDKRNEKYNDFNNANADSIIKFWASRYDG